MLNIISDFISRTINLFSNWTEVFWSNFDLSTLSNWQIFLDIAFVALIFYWIFLLIQGTRAVPVIIGLIFLAMIFSIAKTFDLMATSWLFTNLTTMIIVAIPIIFQPEIRRGLEKLGQTSVFSRHGNLEEKQVAVDSILDAVSEFLKNKTGATIVLEMTTSLNEYVNNGSKLMATSSSELLRSIFQKKSPLHDGAVIISNNGKVLSAGSVLPLSTTDTTNKKWGTRHKSALGLSEQTDALIIVVSEERKEVSLFEAGYVVEKLTINKLKLLLEKQFLPKSWRRKIKK